jgi:hypothetical protein
LVKKENFPHQMPSGMQGFVYNLRRPLFQDVRVRQALAYAFDFEWSNRNLFFGQYTRTRSFFDNSELAARGLPSPEELALLEPSAQGVAAGSIYRRVSAADRWQRRAIPRQFSESACSCCRKPAGNFRIVSWSTPKPANRSASNC